MTTRLCILFVISGLFLKAQRNPNNTAFFKARIPFRTHIEPDKHPEFFKNKPKPGAVKRNEVNCNANVFTVGPNAFGTGGDFDTQKQGCLTYQKDLNAVVWTHRASPLWLFPGNTNGAIQVTWMNIGTGVWDSTILYRDSASVNGARFPSGTIFNPVGNTNVSNAYAVGSGPVTNNSSAFIGTWYSQRQLTGNYHVVSALENNNQVCLSNQLPFGDVQNNFGISFLDDDMQQVGNKIVVGGGLVDETLANPSQFQNIVKGGVVASTALSFNWNRDSIIPGFYFDPVNGYASDGEGLRLAFAPDGLTGYAFFLGRLATNYGTNTDSMLSPLIYKTSNGGQTWSTSALLAGYDWTDNHKEVFRNVGKLRFAYARQYQLFDSHGIDLTVDSTGTLHVVATVTDPYLGLQPALDSLSFFYVHQWDYKKNHPIIWDFMTDGSSWKTLLIDSIMTGELGAAVASQNSNALDSTAQYNPWVVGGDMYLAYGARIQVSRSPSGGKVFYSWADSDSSKTHSLLNIAPDIHIRSYDISHQKMTPSVDVTKGNGNCFFHFMSDITYFDNGTQAWVCPMVYTTDRIISTPPFNASDVVNYNYLSCATFFPNQYSDTAIVYQAHSSGMVNYNKHSDANLAVQNYPNPFSDQTTIQIHLNKAGSIQVRVYDLLGNQLYESNMYGAIGENYMLFNENHLASGVYYYTVQVEEEQVSQKMIIQK